MNGFSDQTNSIEFANREGHLSVVQSLLDSMERAFDMNAENSMEETPLLIASGKHVQNYLFLLVVGIVTTLVKSLSTARFPYYTG